MKRSMRRTMQVFFLTALLAVFAGRIQFVYGDDDLFEDVGDATDITQAFNASVTSSETGIPDYSIPPPPPPGQMNSWFPFAIGTTYALRGPYIGTETSISGYTIFYPERMDGGHPIITWGNGTGGSIDGYIELLRHLVTWGFVVIASESGMTGSGIEMIEGVDYLLEQNMRPNSVFYRRLNPRRIGTTGHSQGGRGSINAAIDPRVTCTLPIAPARGDIEQVSCPIFLIAGSEDKLVPATFVGFTNYSSANAPTILGVVQDMDHGDFTANFGKARGYITAWFMYQLKGDRRAAQAFIDKCEICNNPDWTVLKKNL